jgi:hypothetical protein
MKKVITLFVAGGVLAWFGSGAAAVTGDFQDHFDQPALKTNWQSAICVADATYPVDWRPSGGILRGYWKTHYGQQHLTVEGPTGPCTIQVRCRLDSANHAQSGALLILKAEDPAIKHPGVGADYFYGWGIGNGTFVFGRVGTTITGGYDFPKIGTRPDLQVGTWHTLKAEINGSHIRCFLDEEMVFETDDTSFSGHYFGVGAALYADVSFDDFQITTPAPPPTAATSRAVGTGQLIDTGWPMGTGSQEKVTFMIVADPASTNPTNSAPARATVVMDSPAIQKLFGKSLVLQGTPEKYVEGGLFSQDPKVEKDLYFKMDDKLIMVGFNDNSLPGNHPDPTLADWVFLSVTDTSSGNPLLVVTGPLTSGDVMDYVPMSTPPVAPTLSVSRMMKVSWPYTLAEFALEGAETADGTWQPVDSWVIDQAGEHQVFLPTTSLMQFFRLAEIK